MLITKKTIVKPIASAFFSLSITILAKNKHAKKHHIQTNKAVANKKPIVIFFISININPTHNKVYMQYLSRLY